jgi:hypothetical protein
MKIHDCARRGDVLGVARELSHGVPVDAPEFVTGYSVLHCACSLPSCSHEMVRFLLKEGARITNDVLDDALRFADIPTLNVLFEFGARVDQDAYHRCGSLTMTAYGRQDPKDDTLLPTLELLLRHGAHPSIESSHGESALSVTSHAGRFDAVRLLLDAGANPAPLKWTELMYAVALGADDDLRVLLDQCESLVDRDRWDRTPWLLSLQAGSITKAQMLMQAGADVKSVGWCHTPAMHLAVEANRPELIAWLGAHGFDANATDEFGNTALNTVVSHGRFDCIPALLRAGANPDLGAPYGKRPIDAARRIDAVRTLAAAGARVMQISPEARRDLMDIYEGDPDCTDEEYRYGRQVRFGRANPQRMNHPFWNAMVRSGCNAYTARRMFGGDDYASVTGPVWCFDRFGRTSTLLPDGSIVEIGGEHEDYYDPDFCIYNDVVVYDVDGQFVVLGYPDTVFPPTDFHTATLVGDEIYIIGCLGYVERRKPDFTPVYKLNIKTWAISRLETTGDCPGWIWNHKAELEPERNRIVISDGEYGKPGSKSMWSFALDLSTCRWEKL